MNTRTQTVFLVVRPGRSNGLGVRVATRAPKLAADEVAMEVDLRVPDAMFRRPSLRATIEIPVESVNRPVINGEVVDNIRQELARTLGVELSISVVEPEA